MVCNKSGPKVPPGLNSGAEHIHHHSGSPSGPGTDATQATVSQRDIKGIYQAAENLLQRGNRIQVIWLPTKVTSQQQAAAKKTAREPTSQEALLEPAPYQARSTTTRRAIEAMKQSHALPGKVGNFTTKLDRALPGKHTKELYDSLKKTEAKILVQLRTVMCKINEYLWRRERRREALFVSLHQMDYGKSAPAAVSYGKRKRPLPMPRG